MKWLGTIVSFGLRIVVYSCVSFCKCEVAGAESQIAYPLMQCSRLGQSKAFGRHVQAAPVFLWDEGIAQRVMNVPNGAIERHADWVDRLLGLCCKTQSGDCPRLDRLCKGAYARALNSALVGEREARHNVLAVFSRFVWQTFDQLGAGTFSGLLKAQSLQHGIGGRQDQTERLSFIFRQPRQACAVIEPKLDAALIALIHNNGQTGFRHGINVAQNCAWHDLKFFGQLGRGLAPPILQQQQDLEKSGSAQIGILT